MKKLRINNKRFSVRFCLAMENLGLTTVGQADSFLNKALPNTKIGVGTSHVRVAILKRELESFFLES